MKDYLNVVQKYNGSQAYILALQLVILTKSDHVYDTDKNAPKNNPIPKLGTTIIYYEYYLLS